MRKLLVLLIAYSAPASAGMSLNVESMTVDGLEIRDLSCEITSGGLFASAEIASGLAKQKASFDQCVAPAGAAFRMQWSVAGGPATGTTVLQSTAPAADKCMVAAFAAVSSTSVASCEGTILAGDATQAAAAAVQLATSK